MTYFEYLNTNLDRVKYDVKIGLISCTIIKHYQIYSRYDYYRRQKYSVSQAVMFTAEDINVRDHWVYCIIKKMEREV